MMDLLVKSGDTEIEMSPTDQGLYDLTIRVRSIKLDGAVKRNGKVAHLVAISKRTRYRAKFANFNVPVHIVLHLYAKPTSFQRHALMIDRHNKMRIKKGRPLSLP